MVAWPNLLSQMEVWFEIYRIREHEWNLPSHTTRICVSGPGAFSSRWNSRITLSCWRPKGTVHPRCQDQMHVWNLLKRHERTGWWWWWWWWWSWLLFGIYIYIYVHTGLSCVYPTGLSNMCNSWKTSTIRMVCIGTISSTECTNLPEVSSWPSEGSFSHGVVGNIEQSVLETSQ